ncbi:unnamed protein product [Calypogeia fissa]
MIMPTCMASGVCSSSFTPICRAPAAPHSAWAKSRVNSIRRTTGLPHVAGLVQALGGDFVKLKGVGRPSSCPVPTNHVKRNGLVSVRAEVPGNESSSSTTTTTTARVAERSEADRLVDGMTFGELCNEFECISSPAVEATARQLVRDILELREGKRVLATYAIFVTYKDPLRSFKGREKFKRPSWVWATLDDPTAAVQEMVMLSTSTLNIKWTLRGKPKLPPASIVGGNLVLTINSTFALNQISGQVVSQVDEWDLSKSSIPALAYFWATRLSYSTVEAGKDAMDAVAGVSKILDKGKDDDRSTYYPDPSGDPNKFFQVDDNPMKDFYQVGLFIALIYLLVQFLKLTL